ncbi:hypothetical protein BASA60_006135 [Batrachochytrium salamandrivorans]|nr:hypothetical protein BASA60_006135 [Batrachochytrium salamandrivorans]
MKFNALVVATMVITSVNAVFLSKLPNGVENSGDKSASSPPSNSVQDMGLDFPIKISSEEKPADGSNVGNTENNPACKRVTSALKGLQDKIRKLDNESKIHQLTLHSLENKINSLEAGVTKDYRFRNEIRAKLKAAKEESDNLKKRARGGFRRSKSKLRCQNSSHDFCK